MSEDNENSSYRYICLSSQIPRGKSKKFFIKDEEKNLEIAVFNVNGIFYAISNSCVHKGGPLSDGFIDGDIVTCPWHGWKYSVKKVNLPMREEIVLVLLRLR